MSGLDDLLKGALGGQGGALGSVPEGLTGGKGSGASSTVMTTLLPMIVGLLMSGGLKSILGKINAAGLTSETDSWVEKGPNHTVTGDQLQKALGSGPIADIAGKLGITHDQAANALAQVLPHVVDHVTPDGSVPAESQLEDVLGQLTAALEGH